jgi:hypothetical protein
MAGNQNQQLNVCFILAAMVCPSTASLCPSALSHVPCRYLSCFSAEVPGAVEVRPSTRCTHDSSAAHFDHQFAKAQLG